MYSEVDHLLKNKGKCEGMAKDRLIMKEKWKPTYLPHPATLATGKQKQVQRSQRTQPGVFCPCSGLRITPQIKDRPTLSYHWWCCSKSGKDAEHHCRWRAASQEACWAEELGKHSAAHKARGNLMPQKRKLAGLKRTRRKMKMIMMNKFVLVQFFLFLFMKHLTPLWGYVRYTVELYGLFLCSLRSSPEGVLDSHSSARWHGDGAGSDTQIISTWGGGAFHHLQLRLYRIIAFC